MKEKINPLMISFEIIVLLNVLVLFRMTISSITFLTKDTNSYAFLKALEKKRIVNNSLLVEFLRYRKKL